MLHVGARWAVPGAGGETAAAVTTIASSILRMLMGLTTAHSLLLFSFLRNNLCGNPPLEAMLKVMLKFSVGGRYCYTGSVCIPNFY